MDVKLLSFIFFLLLVPGVLAISVEIHIDEKIDGYMPWFNVTSHPPQKFSISWENTGSFFCRSRARIDFYNESRRVYTSWGPEDVLSPGETKTWELYSYLYPGEYFYNITVYHCNEIYNQGHYSILVRNVTPVGDVIEIVNSNSNDNSVEIYVRSNRDLSNVLVIPEKYPITWVFGTGKIDSIKSGETKPVKISYEPVNWEGEVVSFVVTTEDGNYAERRPIILRKQEPSHDRLIFVLVMLAALLIYLYYKKINFLIWKR